MTKRGARFDPRPPQTVRLGIWREEAACHGQHEVFIGPLNESKPKRERRERAAKAICSSCPVIAECRRHAVVLAEPYGVWGGLSVAERRKHKR